MFLPGQLSIIHDPLIQSFVHYSYIIDVFSWVYRRVRDIAFCTKKHVAFELPLGFTGLSRVIRYLALYLQSFQVNVGGIGDTFRSSFGFRPDDDSISALRGRISKDGERAHTHCIRIVAGQLNQCMLGSVDDRSTSPDSSLPATRHQRESTKRQAHSSRQVQLYDLKICSHCARVRPAWRW